MVFRRQVLVLVLLLAVTMGGCVVERQDDPGTATAGGTSPSAGSASPWFDTATAEGTHPQTGHSLDTTYSVDRTHTWDQLAFSVLIIGPDVFLPTGGSLHDATEAGIDIWKTEIDAHGPPRLRHNVTFDVHYSPHVPPAMHIEHDIIINWFYWRGGFASKGLIDEDICLISMQADLVFFTDLTWREAYLTSAHEFGHCLGVAHPDDHCPWQDLLAYDHQCPTQDETPGLPHDVECVSTLDLAILEHAFAPAFGEAGEGSVTMSALDYWIHDCESAVLGES